MKKALPSSAALLLVLAAGAFLFYRYYYTPRVQRAASQLQAAVEGYVMNTVLGDPVLLLARGSGQVLDITARMPARYTPQDLKAGMEALAGRISGASVACTEFSDARTESLTAAFETPFSMVCKVRFLRSQKPKIAIILDDWGYSKKGFTYLRSIKEPFTAAVLPGLMYSREAAQEAHDAKKGVMLHLPMQAKGNAKREKTTIMAGMDRGSVTEIVERLSRDIPYFTGVNNHEGSKATEDGAVMQAVVSELKQRNIFFIDNLTSPGTMAWKTAKMSGARWGKRDVFIDNEKEPGYIAGQMAKLAKIARERGWAIGIGHDDPVTLGALSGIMPEMEAQGVEFVYAAEVVK